MILFHIVKNYVAADSGAIAPLAAFMFLTLMGFAGLAVDVGMWMNQKHVLQTATDAAALAGAYELSHGFTHAQAEAAALREAQNNGYDPAAASASLVVVIAGDEHNDDDITTTVEVTIKQKATSWFSALLSDQTVITGTTATAEVEATEGIFCMLSLDGGITISGNVTVDAAGCGLASNSTDADSLSMNGNVFVNVGDVSLAGGVSGAGEDFHYTSLHTNTSQTSDPYKNLELNHVSVCTAEEVTDGMRITSTAELTAAPHYPVLCGNITFQNGDIVMPANTYIIESGDIDTSGNGSLTATDVTIILTNSTPEPAVYGNLKSTGTFDISISAPSTGDYAGIAIYQDRNAPDDGSDNKLTGTAGLQVDGVIYTPSRSISFGGNHAVTSAADVCSKIIAKSLSFHGTPTIGSNCADSGTASIGTPAVRLIL